MDLLLLLRIFTLLLRLCLAGALVYFLLTHGGTLTRRYRAAWTALAGVEVLFALNTGVLEVVHVLRWLLAREDLLGEAYVYIYHSLFLLNALIDAWLPLVLITLFAHSGHLRRLFKIALVAVAGVGAIAVPAGGLVNWADLLTFGQILSFCAIIGYLAFTALLFVGGLGRIGIHLACFVGVAALFQILLPVQEAIFQMFDRQASMDVWVLHQLLQFARVAAMLAIVGGTIRAANRGSRVKLVPTRC